MARRTPSQLNMLLAVDKPVGCTSHDVVSQCRRALHERRIGHAGTLDPLATGLLVVLVGRATRAAAFAEAETKEYIAAFRPGIVTDTQDITGNLLRSSDVLPSEEDVRAALPRFTGEIEQIPPMYSAIKINGRKLYDIARRGGEVEREARRITNHSIDYLGQENGDHMLRIRCSKGTYVRTLCHDLGQMLGCGACMSSLRRTKAGMFTLSQAITVPQILEFAKENDPQELLMPVDALFSQYPPLIVELGQAEKLRHGAQIKDWHFAPGTYRVYSITGEFLLLGKVENTILTTIKSFFEV